MELSGGSNATEYYIHVFSVTVLATFYNRTKSKVKNHILAIFTYFCSVQEIKEEMKTYWRLLGFAKPIEKYAIPYFFCTLLYAFFNVCTFTLIMPIVNSLFSPDGALQAVTEMPVFSIRHLTDYISALLSYLLYRLFGSDYDIMDVLIMLACVVVTASLLSNLFRYLAQRIIENMRVRTLCRLRDRVYEHVLSMNLGFFSNERKGDIMARITSDVQVVQFCITNTLQVVFRDPFLILFYVVAMLAISVQLSLFSVIYLPVVALLIGTIVKRLRRSAKEVQESFGELTSVLDESLSGMKVIKGYNAETFFGRRFNDINRKFSDISRRIAYRQQLASPMSEFLGIAAAAGLLIFGGILVTGGKLDAGGFLTYLAIFTQITRPMRSFTDAFATINQGIAAGDRVLRLLDTETSVRNAPAAVQLDHFRERIEFRDVRFAYEEREVICGISFTVEKGQTVALVGPSGGGKSTISDLIPRFYDVTAGEIRIDGRDIRQYDLHSLRERMGIVAQDTVLFNDTIENNIRLGNSEATREEVMDAARIANAEQFIAETPLRPGDEHRRPRRETLRRAASAPQHRPRRSQKPRNPHPRRGDIRPRHRERKTRTGGPQHTARRAHIHRHRPPFEHDTQRG